MDDMGGEHLSLRAARARPSPLCTEISRSAREIAGRGCDLEAALAWTRAVGRDIAAAPDAATRWEALASVAAAEVAAARILEPHVDALLILGHAGGTEELLARVGADDRSTWGVFAAEADGVSLNARPSAEGWRLTGTKPWCSLAGRLSHALVTAHTGARDRRLFAVDLRGDGVHPHSGPWVSRGLAQIVSAPVDFARAAAFPVGDDGWYLRRPGFAWGGIAVAAVWWGGAIPLVGALVAAAAARDGADQLAAVYAGEADAALWAARAVLVEAAARVDDGEDDASAAPEVIAHRARSVVAGAVERVLSLAERALGPAPLTNDEEYARRIADLRIYVRQHHAERDLARLGRKLAAS